MDDKDETDGWEKVEVSGFWKPEKEGEEIVGTVKEINEGNFGKDYVIELSDGESVRLPAFKVLQARLKNIKIGAAVKIIYRGAEPPKLKGYKPTELFDVYWKKQANEPKKNGDVQAFL